MLTLKGFGKGDNLVEHVSVIRETIYEKVFTLDSVESGETYYMGLHVKCHPI